MSAHNKLGLYPVAAFLILDHEGHVLLSKYYRSQPPQQSQQHNQEKRRSLEDPDPFEQLLHQRINAHPNNEVILLDDGQVALFKINLDVTVIVIGQADANELLLADLLEAFYEVLGEILKPQIDKKGLLEHYDQVLMILDELIEKG